MIERKKVWVVKDNLYVEEKEALIEDGYVVCVKDGTLWNNFLFGGKFFDKEEAAKTWRDEEVEKIRKKIPEVKEFIERLRHIGFDNSFFKWSFDDFGVHDSSEEEIRLRDMYIDEGRYAQNLEAYIRSRVLTIDDDMIPVDRVKRVSWYLEGGRDEDEEDDIIATLTLDDGDTVDTTCEREVRLVKLIFGENGGRFDYERR